MMEFLEIHIQLTDGPDCLSSLISEKLAEGGGEPVVEEEEITQVMSVTKNGSEGDAGESEAGKTKSEGALEDIETALRPSTGIDITCARTRWPATVNAWVILQPH
jgi:hypothetical protein